MLQVVIFDQTYVGDLEWEVNKWLKEHENYDIVDIKVSAKDNSEKYYCVIQYRK